MTRTWGRGLSIGIVVIGCFLLGLFVGRIDDHSSTKILADLPSQNDRYVISSQGLVRAQFSYGLPYEDLNFLSQFYGPLLETVPSDSQELKQALRERLLADFRMKESLVEKRFPALNHDERLVGFVMLRVSGSIPVFKPAGDLPDSLEKLLTSFEGSCADYSIRMAMALDVLGIGARLISFWTPSLPGHVVVESFDRQSGSTTLIDVLNHLVFFVRNAKRPFLETIAGWSSEKRQQYIDFSSDHIMVAPFYIRFYHPGNWLQGKAVLTRNQLNTLNSDRRLTGWQATLTKELSIMFSKWNKESSLGPLTLNEWSGTSMFKADHALKTDSLWTVAMQSKDSGGYDQLSPEFRPPAGGVLKTNDNKG